MATADSPLSGADPGATTDDQWKQWALAVFGGNDARASAAGQAAAAARCSGASSDELFAAAQAAYHNVGLVAAPESGWLPAVTAPTNIASCVVRPSGRLVLGLVLMLMLAVGTVLAILRLGSLGAIPIVVTVAVIMAAWYALSLRACIRVAGATVTVQGVLHRRVFQRLDVSQITVQPRSRQMGMVNGPMRGQFLASFISNDFTHLFELRQGAWTRSDIDRIGAAIGVQVVDDSTQSIT